MARWSLKVSAFSALLLLFSTTSWVLAQEDDSDDGVTVEVSFSLPTLPLRTLVYIAANWL